eukprot:gene45428-56587_t
MPYAGDDPAVVAEAGEPVDLAAAVMAAYAAHEPAAAQPPSAQPHAAQLAAVPVPNPSATVQRYMGTPSVSEAAALLAARADLRALVVEKHKLRGPDGKNATVSIARMETPMHIEIGIISPEKLAYAGVAATALLGAHTMGLLKSPTAWLRTALAAFFFSLLMQAWHLPVGPSELHLVGAMPIYLLFGFIPTLFGFGLG